MSPEKIAFIVVFSIFGLALIALIAVKGPKRIKQEQFKKKWKTLQSRCSDKEQWAQAIIEADDLLAEALKKKRIKGKTTGERMVAAQKIFTDNDAAWFGHRLRKQLDAYPDAVPRKQDVKKALLGLGQALKDIGVLR